MAQQGRYSAKIVAVTNQKGGVGKTTTAINLAACLASVGHQTLLVDMDPQANATSGVGVPPADLQASIYDGLLGHATGSDLIQETTTFNLYCLPATPALAGAEVELVSEEDRTERLKWLLEPLRSQYATIIIDCPPSLSLLTLNALVAADSLIIPVQCEYYALEGLGRLLSTIELVRENLNPDLELEGVLMTMFDKRNNLARQVVAEVVEHFGGLAYTSVIPRNVRLAESPSYGQPIITYDRMSRGAHSYLDLAEEFLQSNLHQMVA